VWEQGERRYRSVVASAETGIEGGPPVRVVVSMDIEHHKEFMFGFERSLWLAIAFAILMTVPFGWLAARGALAPLRHMADVARSVSASRLHARIDTAALPVELHGLAADFNGMMVRLEDDFAKLQAFSSDIAHELRTPVSNLMTQTQVALSRARTAEAYSDILHSNLEEFDRLARMIADMLFLAQADNGLLPRPAETVALAVEADALAEFYEALAEERGVKIEVSGAAAVAGDRLMLRRALSNLLSNALRYALPDSVVAIGIASDGVYARLGVENAGETIPSEHLERLFVRFHRVDSSRTRRGDGAGLGLAITRSIVEAHGGRISVDSRDGVTRFSFVLPVVGVPDTAGRGGTDGPIHSSNRNQTETRS
jgi:two-component system heavy metal sensor histidine kinase CusS